MLRWLAHDADHVVTQRNAASRPPFNPTVTTTTKEKQMLKSSVNHIFRQGDVLLVRVGELPKHAQDVTPSDRIVLAYGEVTGHAHAIYEPLTKARLWNADAERFLQIIATTGLRHEEHATIELPVGVYKVVQQREYQPEGIRNVAD
jgi:hypothetical protein